MSDILSLATVIFAGTVNAYFQLEIGTLLLLYHASLGRHIRKKTKKLVSSFIAGIGYIVLITLSAVCFALSFLWNTTTAPAILIALSVALVFFGALAFFTYYRLGSGTELWLPHPVSKYITTRAKATSSEVEAFSLGLLTFIGELPFSAVLLVTAASAILELPFACQLLSVALYTIIVLIPILAMRIFIHRGKTVVEIQRWRVKHKKFFRNLIAFGFIILAAFIASFRILGQ